MNSTTLAKVSASSNTTHIAHLDSKGRVVALECGQRGGRMGLGVARKAAGVVPTCAKCAASAEGQARAALPVPPAS